MKSEGLANGGEKKEKEKERREEKRKKKGGRGIVGERGGPNLVEEDCFHSVLKLKRSEDRRPRFESRLSAGDNQTGGDLFSPSLSSPSSPLFPPSFREETEEETKWRGWKEKEEVESGNVINFSLNSRIDSRTIEELTSIYITINIPSIKTWTISDSKLKKR